MGCVASSTLTSNTVEGTGGQSHDGHMIVIRESYNDHIMVILAT